MTEVFNWMKLIVVFILSLVASLLLTNSLYVDLSQILLLGNDLQYNLISTSATIAGFLFTGVSILISAIANKRIERLWNNAYLNNLYRSAFIGIVANVLTIICALIMVFFVLSEDCMLRIVQAEIIAVLISVVFFGWCVLDLIFILANMKPTDDNEGH